MSDITISIPGGETKRLLTGGKYCPDDIVVEAVGGDADAVFEAGRKAEYDAFWEKYLASTNNRSALFAGGGWTDEIFAPPTDIVLFDNGNTANAMFMYSNIKDMAGCLERQGVYIDARQYRGSNGFLNWFSYSQVTHVGRIKFPSTIARWSGTFTDCKNLIAVEELKCSDGTTFTASTFQSCINLEHMIVTGVIAQNGFNVKDCKKLTKTSITSIINALSPTTSGLTVTISKTAKEAAFTAEEWSALVATKSNWTISLA